jgi:hypothetical protein
MRSPRLVRFAFLVMVWAGIASAASVHPARAQGTPIPNNVNATMARILATARKSWHGDAIITSVEMKWYPTADLDAPGGIWVLRELAQCASLSFYFTM